MSEHRSVYLCTNPECANQFEAKRKPKACDICGASVTKRPNDNARYDFATQTWVDYKEEDDDD
jgi:hypothetical protein